MGVKIAVLSNDKSLINKLVENKEVELKWIYPTSIAIKELIEGNPADKKSADVLVISDRLLTEELSFSLSQISSVIEAEKIIYLLSNQHNNEENQRIIRYLLAQGVYVVRPGRSEQDIIAEIQQIAGISGAKTKEGKIAAFTGTTPNLGTTVIALNSTIELARRINEKILFIDLNLKSGKTGIHLGINQTKHSLDAIFLDITTKTLYGETLTRHAYKLFPNLDVIIGTAQRERAEYFEIEHIDNLLESAAVHYDLVIVDVHPYWDNAATYQTLIKADFRYMVTTSELSNFHHDLEVWVNRVAGDFGIDKKKFDLIINQSGGSFAKSLIMKQTAMNVIAEIPYYPEVIRESINQGEPLLLFNRDHRLQKDLQPIVQQLINLGGLKTKEHLQDQVLLGKKKKGILQRIGGVL